jgi:hypothetical protein
VPGRDDRKSIGPPARRTCPQYRNPRGTSTAILPVPVSECRYVLWGPRGSLKASGFGDGPTLAQASGIGLAISKCRGLGAATPRDCASPTEFGRTLGAGWAALRGGRRTRRTGLPAGNWLCLAPRTRATASQATSPVGTHSGCLSRSVSVKLGLFRTIIPTECLPDLAAPGRFLPIGRKLGLFRRIGLGGSPRRDDRGKTPRHRVSSEGNWLCLYSTPCLLSPSPAPHGLAGNWLCFADAVPVPNLS